MKSPLSAVGCCLLLALGLSFPARLPAEEHATTPAASADAVWSDLMQGNRRFVAGKLKPHPLVSRRSSLAKGQSPGVAVLSCSDSRVPPELVFDRGPGDLFVVRVAGNVADRYGTASLEYAFEHLGTTTLVVLGHDSCGAVIAACEGKPLPTESLEALRSAIAPACQKNPKMSSAEQLHDSVVANVHKSVADLLAQGPELNHAVQAGKLVIIQAIYKLDTGEVVRID